MQHQVPTIRALVNWGAAILTSSPSPRLDAELLLARALDQPRAYLYTHPGKAVEPSRATAFRLFIEKRATSVPLAYLTGEKEFWSRKFHVDQSTLIPRSETELLVEQSLACIPAQLPARIIELGTGSGAIAITLALERQQASLIAIDVSLDALRVAQRNARTHAAPVAFAQMNWLESIRQLDTAVDAIVANPPYVAENDPHLSRGALTHEPCTALLAGRDGLDAIRSIINQAPSRLALNGKLLLEHGFEQGERVRQLLREGGFGRVMTLNDLGGHERVSVGSRNTSWSTL